MGLEVFSGEKNVVIDGWRNGVMPLMFQAKMRNWVGWRGLMRSGGAEMARDLGGEEVRRRLKGGGLMALVLALAFAGRLINFRANS